MEGWFVFFLWSSIIWAIVRYVIVQSDIEVNELQEKNEVKACKALDSGSEVDSNGTSYTYNKQDGDGLHSNDFMFI